MRIDTGQGEHAAMKELLGNAILGVGSGLAAVGFTLSDLEQWLRISGGAGALLVTLATLINITKNWKWGLFFRKVFKRGE